MTFCAHIPFFRRAVIAALWVFFALTPGASAAADDGRGNTGVKKEATAEVPVYRLGSGDEVKVTVFGEEDLSGKFQVDGGGYIAMPLIGGIEVGGLSFREVEEVITTKLLDGYLKRPRVAVEVLNYRPFYILGEVNEPGSFPYVNGMTIYNAVALGGGFTYRADEDDIKVTRANDKTKTPRPAQLDTAVLPGDIIRVEERFF